MHTCSNAKTDHKLSQDKASAHVVQRKPYSQTRIHVGPEKTEDNCRVRMLVDADRNKALYS